MWTAPVKISGYNINNIRYEDDTGGKFKNKKKIKVIKESKKKKLLTVRKQNAKETVKVEVYIKMKPVQKFYYFVRVATNNII